VPLPRVLFFEQVVKCPKVEVYKLAAMTFAPPTPTQHGVLGQHFVAESNQKAFCASVADAPALELRDCFAAQQQAAALFVVPTSKEKIPEQ
jgi:hypothetical protein